jgi:hypothetical protein
LRLTGRERERERERGFLRRTKEEKLGLDRGKD